jgi:hypothetical protein
MNLAKVTEGAAAETAGMEGAAELRDRDSNPNFRFQRPASYR